MQLLLQALYIMIPAYVANMAPVWVKSIPLLDIPMDFGQTFRHKRIFGAHKTWRGFSFGVLMSLAAIYLQSVLYSVDFFRSISLINYRSDQVLPLLGMGAGALLGDAVKSFFKRQVGVAEGRSWIPFDQIDFVVGALVVTAGLLPLTILHIVIILLISPILHVLANIFGYYVGINKKPL